MLYLEISTCIKIKDTMKYINFSQQESEMTNLRIGRTDVLYEFNAEQLIKEIFELRLDICRLKADISNPEIFNLLDQIYLPKFNHSFLIEQKIELNKIEKDLEVDIEIKEYDSSKKEALLDIIQKIQNSDVFNVYYKSEIMEKLISNSLLNEIIADYQTTFDSKLNKNKNCFLAYKDENLIGFCTIDTSNNFGEGILVGIIPEYRSLDLFKNFVRTQINYSKKMECESYICKTIAFNSRSLNTTLKQGMKISKVMLNINILSLFNYESETYDIHIKKDNVLTCIIDTLDYKRKKYIKEMKIDCDLYELDTLEIKLFKNLKLGILMNKENNKTGYLLFQ